MQKDMYNIAYQLIRKINIGWTENNEDIVVQFSCMDTNSYVNIHQDKDVSSQFFLVLLNT